MGAGLIDGFAIPTALHLLLMGCAITAAVSFVTAIAICLSPSLQLRFLQTVIPLFCFSLPVMGLGACVGYLMSLSREPAVSATIPAVLSLVGGLLIYVYSLDNIRKSIVAGTATVVFTLNLMLGSAFGSYLRETGRTERMLYAVEQERKIRNYRESRGLPADIPTWTFK